MHELDASDALKLRVPFALGLRVLPVVPPVVEPDVLARSRLCQPDKQLPASAAHVQQTTPTLDRVDEQLVNPSLEVATPRAESVGRQSENDRDVQKRNGKKDYCESRRPR